MYCVQVHYYGGGMGCNNLVRTYMNKNLCPFCCVALFQVCHYKLSFFTIQTCTDIIYTYNNHNKRCVYNLVEKELNIFVM